MRCRVRVKRGLWLSAQFDQSFSAPKKEKQQIRIRIDSFSREAQSAHCCGIVV